MLSSHISLWICMCFWCLYVECGSICELCNIVGWDVDQLDIQFDSHEGFVWFTPKILVSTVVDEGVTVSCAFGSACDIVFSMCLPVCSCTML